MAAVALQRFLLDSKTGMYFAALDASGTRWPTPVNDGLVALWYLRPDHVGADRLAALGMASATLESADG